MNHDGSVYAWYRLEKEEDEWAFSFALNQYPFAMPLIDYSSKSIAVGEVLLNAGTPIEITQAEFAAAFEEVKRLIGEIKI
mgnify:CR=1 FL=1